MSLANYWKKLSCVFLKTGSAVSYNFASYCLLLCIYCTSLHSYHKALGSQENKSSVLPPGDREGKGK